MDTLKQACVKRLGALKAERADWEPYWRDLSEWFQPRRGRFNASDRKRATKRSSQIIDSAARIALRTLASGLMAGLTSPARPWFRLGTQDPALMEWGPVKEWLNQVQVRMREMFNRSNLYASLPGVYEELGLFGTAAESSEDDPDTVVRFHPFTVGEYYLALSSSLRVDTCYRELTLTVAQVVQMFGREACSLRVRDLWDRSSYDQAVEIVQAIEPNVGRIAEKIDGKNKPFLSVYFETGGEQDKILRQGGFDEFPIFCPRWDAVSGDVYGGSPAMDALGDTRQLQTQQRRKAQAIDKAVNPPLQGPSTLKNIPVTVLPGGITLYDDQSGGKGLRPVYEVRPGIAELAQDMAETRERIRSAMFADLFLMLAMSDRTQMTATEVSERHEEKLLMLGPVLERLHSELLSPKIDRTFAQMIRAGQIPPPPEDLQGQSLKVEYISMLAQAQKLVGLGAVDRLLDRATATAAVYPDVLDKVDFDQAMDEYGDMLGVPPALVRSDEDVAILRDARAKAQARAMAAQNIGPMASAAKTMAETPTDGQGNLLTDLAGAFAPQSPSQVPSVV